MANYPAVPTRRMGWDADGTWGAYWFANNPGFSYSNPSTPWTVMSGAQKAELNDEDLTIAISGGSSFPTGYVAIVFPELRDIDGFFDDLMSQYGNVPSYASAASPNTTNGSDGTWTDPIVSGKSAPSTKYGPFAAYRTNIEVGVATGVRGLRFIWNGSAGSGYCGALRVHIYGEISAGQTPDRLLHVDDSTGLEFANDLDLEDWPRGAAVDKVFKIKNNSSTLTASTISVTSEAGYGNSGAWSTYSDGGAFAGSLNLSGSIGPGASSPTITQRIVVPGAETLHLHAARTKVVASSWT